MYFVFGVLTIDAIVYLVAAFASSESRRHQRTDVDSSTLIFMNIFFMLMHVAAVGVLLAK